MARLKTKNWQHGGIMYHCGVLWVQRTDDGWFAKMEDEERKLLILSGPWPSQSDAEHELIDAVERIVVGTEGE